MSTRNACNGDTYMQSQSCARLDIPTDNPKCTGDRSPQWALVHMTDHDDGNTPFLQAHRDFACNPDVNCSPRAHYLGQLLRRWLLHEESTTHNRRINGTRCGHDNKTRGDAKLDQGQKG